jgi:hypothetical protein
VDLSLSVPLHSFLYNGAYAKTYYQRPNIRMTARYLSAFCETPHAAFGPLEKTAYGLEGIEKFVGDEL